MASIKFFLCVFAFTCKFTADNSCLLNIARYFCHQGNKLPSQSDGKEKKILVHALIISEKVNSHAASVAAATHLHDSHDKVTGEKDNIV